MTPTPVPPAFGPLIGRAGLRGVPEDFRVRERSSIQAAGDGEHWLITIRKRGLTTDEAARRIAAHFGVRPRDIGVAGMKDRHAVTEQAMTVHVPGRAQGPEPLVTPELAVLTCERHDRKLRRGVLAGNRFEITLRGVDADPRAVDARLAAIAGRGVPNAFGDQRFGRAGRNLDKAAAWLSGGMTVRKRSMQSILLSSVRSEAFNRVLAARVRAGTWDRALAGELLMFEGGNAVFDGDTDSVAVRDRRVAAMDVHPTGPLPGRGGVRPRDDALAVEQAASEGLEDLIEALAARRVDAARRALRVCVGSLGWEWLAARELVVRFELPPGAYATTVLGQCFELVEASDGSPDQGRIST